MCYNKNMIGYRLKIEGFKALSRIDRFDGDFYDYVEHFLITRCGYKLDISTTQNNTVFKIFRKTNNKFDIIKQEVKGPSGILYLWAINKVGINLHLNKLHYHFNTPFVLWMLKNY